MAFIAIAGALAILNLASAFPHLPCAAPALPACAPVPLPQIVPTVLQQQLPGPIVIGPQAPGVIEHVAAPYEITYFGKPYIIKHKQSAALNILAQTPVVVDEYAAPSVNEALAPPAVVVETVCPPAPAPIPAPVPKYFPAPAPCH